MPYVGIDPGFEGAICFLDRTPSFFDMPTLVVQTKPLRREYDMAGTVGILKLAQGGEFFVALERQQPMPGGREADGSIRSKGGIASFKQGLGFGMFQGMLAALDIPYELVLPVTWKRSLMPGMTKEKKASCLVAQRLFPNAADQLTRVKDHGRADSLLIAEYVRRRHNAGTEEMYR